MKFEKRVIKDTLVDEMENIHGGIDGWWTEPETLNEVSEAIINALDTTWKGRIK